MSGLLRELQYGLPMGLRMALLVRRREPFWLKRGIVFIHVPKAAGTSLNEAMYGQFMGHARATDIERWGSARLRALPRFAVVRNPWDRLVSAYRFAKRGAGIGGIVAGIRNPKQFRVPEFESFQGFVHEWLAQRDVTKLDGVFRPQHLYVCDRGGQLLVDHIGRLEDLAPTHAFIERTLSRAVDVPRSNQSGEPIDYRQLYTPEMQHIVGNIYRRDVERFGYDF